MAKPGIIVLFGNISDNSLHKHHAIQIILTSEQDITICIESDTVSSSGLIVKHNISHRISGKNCLLFLIEPECTIGKNIQLSLLKGNPYCEIPDNTIIKCRTILKNKPASWKSAQSVLQSIVEFPGIQSFSEERINRIIQWIDSCESSGSFDQVTLKPALDLIHLSESRFLHLFSEQMGITWRRYLLWRRLLAAVNYAISGKSLTESAHHAGFSDSAHLSRTFRKMFGFSPGFILKNSRFIQVP